MAKLTGKAAEDFVNERFRKQEREEAETLQRRKEEAAARGKEPFDLAKLETMCDTSSEGRLDPLEERRKRFELKYYVNHPAIMTLAEFAALIERVSKW
jgi:hypothetical protein